MLSNIKTNNNDILKEFGFTITKTQFLSFEKCREEVRESKFKIKKEYYKNRKPNWPSQPYKIYKNQGWNGWEDFLDNGFLSFKECLIEVRKCRFKNREEYYENRKPNWPCTPYKVYKNQGWNGWEDFLDNGLLSFKKCREEVRNRKFKSIEEYRKNRKPNWPRDPYVKYKNQGWNGSNDFLGK